MAFKKFPRRKNFLRPMVKGKWNCSDCGVEINELPFHPSQDRPVYCKDCWQKKKHRS